MSGNLARLSDWACGRNTSSKALERERRCCTVPCGGESSCLQLSLASRCRALLQQPCKMEKTRDIHHWAQEEAQAQTDRWMGFFCFVFFFFPLMHDQSSSSIGCCNGDQWKSLCACCGCIPCLGFLFHSWVEQLRAALLLGKLGGGAAVDGYLLRRRSCCCCCCCRGIQSAHWWSGTHHCYLLRQRPGGFHQRSTPPSCELRLHRCKTSFPYVPCHDRHCCQAPAARAESSVTVSLLFSSLLSLSGCSPILTTS